MGPSSYKESVISEELFQEGKDDIVYEGELMKFKPGLSANFILRYVQISRRAFRYFKNRYEAKAGKPIVAFRKKIIQRAVPYKVNKTSYVKPGSRIAQAGTEDALFDNMFEVILNEDYEDNYQFRDQERAEKELKDRKDFRKALSLSKSAILKVDSARKLAKSQSRSFIELEKSIV